MEMILTSTLTHYWVGFYRGRICSLAGEGSASASASASPFSGLCVGGARGEAARLDLAALDVAPVAAPRRLSSSATLA